MKVKVVQRTEGGDPAHIDEREWTVEMLAALEHANYLTLNGAEYEMLEGRLDVNTGALELLVEKVQADQPAD